MESFTLTHTRLMDKVIPFRVVVNEHVVLHGQFKVWDLLTHPPRQRHGLELDRRQQLAGQSAFSEQLTNS